MKTVYAKQPTASIRSQCKLRMLVVIACYGVKNLAFLKTIIRKYRQMELDVDISVISEATKSLDEDINLIVGMPTKNPWSLPFAHKKIFAQNVESYDLFIYTEDDIEITEEQIRAFLRVSQDLEPWEIAGYVRYETDESGNKILTDIHGPFHWNPDSVRNRSDHTVAELTNEHAGFYILTQGQLRRAIASGGFLRAPYEGRFGLPETAATDPYTSCGFRKVICISDFDNFLIRHMSNLYASRHGLPLSSCRQQIKTLLEIVKGERMPTVLCGVEPKVLQRNWSKSFFEKTCPEVMKAVPTHAESVLSVGAGSGNFEEHMRERGVRVTALPLNSVVGAQLSHRNFEIINGSLAQCARNLSARKFDCVLISHIIHLLADPWTMLRDYAKLVGNSGSLLIVGYNFEFLPHLLKRVLGKGDYRKLSNFEESGLRPHGIGALKKQIQSLGLKSVSVTWFDDVRPDRRIAASRFFGRFMARNWVISATSNKALPQP